MWNLHYLVFGPGVPEFGVVAVAMYAPADWVVIESTSEMQSRWKNNRVTRYDASLYL
jgi:hypothetical protein